MRKIIDRYFIKNHEFLKDKIRFIFNDLWSFDSKDLSFACDLNCKENMIWSYAYGKFLAGFLPIVYGVSFFSIGRLEQLRKFFGYNKAPVLIINAGAVGYNNYGWEHAIVKNEDILILKTLKFECYDFSQENQQNDLNFAIKWQKIINTFLNKANTIHPVSIYLKLGKDISKKDNKC